MITALFLAMLGSWALSAINDAAYQGPRKARAEMFARMADG